MPRSFHTAAAAFAAAIALFAFDGGSAEAATANSGDFDFYVLSLSWSPSYCASAGKRANKRECGGPVKYGFIVHGLWPQTQNGHPENCSSSFPKRVPQALGKNLYDIMPSMALIGHEWRTHGTCTGLSQKAYFARLRQAWQKIVVPTELSRTTAPKHIEPGQIETAFVKANPGLQTNAISVSCSTTNARLQDVRICLTKSLDFRACPALDAQGCSQTRLSTALSR